MPPIASVLMHPLAPAALSACPLLVLALGVFGHQRSDADPRFSEEAWAEHERRRRAIIRESEAEDAPTWSGSYYWGYGTGINKSLSLAPSSGFVFRATGCIGPGDLSYGTIQVEDGRVVLRPEYPNSRTAVGGVATELVIVRWHQRTYLVASDRMIDFVNDVNSGLEPRRSRWGGHFLRLGDELRSAEGLPILPPSYQRLLLPEPVVSRVVEVTSAEDPDPDDGRRGPVTVVIDRGSESGIYAGLRLFVETGRRWPWFEIVEVEPERSIARSEGWRSDTPLPAIGSTATTLP